ncbi:hypothetical protein [Brevibacterium luteolum]|uniref:Uncharacterized protein n=1 Tax=Brevibacterium luteolum TaxID=199591 RepID=A0A849AM37_9MICO|nr:hypothetical protein [Brevibacterium luteolum]MBM7530447.1 hypothetical protein [Brevibacterium luteolum]NNG77843.1 hypothetical protein [Brevibacterium luteolum]
MLSLAEYRASLCPICGYSKDICHAAENENRFDVPPPARCHASTAIRRARENAEYEHPDCLTWSTVLKP